MFTVTVTFTASGHLRCQDCGTASPDVRVSFCPYAADVHDRQEPCVCCRACYHERAQDI
jgi:hypothetical protein